VPEETCFEPAGFSDQWKVPALLYIGKRLEYRPFCDFRRVPRAYWPRAQISNHRRACTEALLLY